MATYTQATGFDKGSAGIPAKGLTKVSMIEVTLMGILTALMLIQQHHTLRLYH